MTDTKTLTGKLMRLERLRNTESGNPRYRVHMSVNGEAVVMLTETDAQVAYVLPNYYTENVTVTLNRKGFVIEAVPA